jgi:hypothetical protein
MSDALLVAAFFDNPSLLAVRFAQTDAATRVARFATTRKPDAIPGGGGIGIVIMVGMALVGTGFGVVPSCSTSSRAVPAIESAVSTDCQKSATWIHGLATLGDDLTPRESLRPWYVRTLLDVPREMSRRGDATGGWLKPRCSSADRAAYRQGMQLAAMLKDAGATKDVAVILDLPGPLAVAAATGMSSIFEPVFTMDNLPHPSGVVPSAQTLAAVVHWRPELVLSRSVRPGEAAPLFVLEGDRLTPYANQSDRFDNRSWARLPDVAGFKALGTSRILYVRQRPGQVAEADDLNQLFIACAEAGLEIKHLALETVERAEAPPEAASTSSTTDRSHVWFWRNYGWGHPAGFLRPEARDADALYRSTPRPATQTAPSAFAQFDGGQRRRSEVLDRLIPPVRSSSGGSWHRTHTHSSG